MNTSAIRTHPNVVFTRLDESQAALLNLDTKAYFTLNETGVRIWQLLDEGRDMAGIVAALKAEYEIDDAKARATVAGFVEELRQEGLLADS